MNKFNKIGVLVAGLALGTIASAARVEVLKTGLYVTLPSDIKMYPDNSSEYDRISGSSDSGLFIDINKSKSNDFFKYDVLNPSHSKRLANGTFSIFKDVKILKSGVAKTNTINFSEYQITATDPQSGTSLYVYTRFAILKTNLLTLNVGSTLNDLERNRKRIADIVGSISTKP